MTLKEAAKLDKYFGLQRKIREIGERLGGEPVCVLDFGDMDDLEGRNARR